MANIKRAKGFDVYGKPPADILARLTAKQKTSLERYLVKVASNVYGIAFDCGRQYSAQEIMRLLTRAKAAR